MLDFLLFHSPVVLPLLEGVGLTPLSVCEQMRYVTTALNDHLVLSIEGLNLERGNMGRTLKY